MAKATAKRARPKSAKIKAPDSQGYEMPDAGASVAETVVAPPEAMPPMATSSNDLQPPRTPIQPEEETKPARTVPARDQIASTINIAKLQAMSMTALNGMAREVGVE